MRTYEPEGRQFWEFRLGQVKELLAEALADGPDAPNPIEYGCPQCGGDLSWTQVLEWRFYPDGNGYSVECTGAPMGTVDQFGREPICEFTAEVIL